MLEFRRFLGVSDCRVPRRVPYGAFSLASVQATAHGVSRALNLLVHFLVALFYAGGGGTPALRRAFPACGRPPGEAVSTSAFLFLFHVFFTFFFLFLDFLHFRHIRGFACDTPGFLRVFGFFCWVVVVCDTPLFWLVFNVSWLFCVDGSSITQYVIY